MSDQKDVELKHSRDGDSLDGVGYGVGTGTAPARNVPTRRPG